MSTERANFVYVVRRLSTLPTLATYWYVIMHFLLREYTLRAYSHQRRAFFSAAEILLRIYQNPMHLNGARWPIHTKDVRFICCGNSAADISKHHAFKWDPLADHVLEAA